MYHAIVKRIALQNFLRLNQKDYASILKGCSSDVHHRFGGDHAVGGERHDREALGRWFERLGQLCPTLQLTVQDVWIKGWPWNTTVIMRWSAVQDLPDGSPYNNHGVHIIRMRWGKVFDIDANEDSQLVAASLQIWAAHGVSEALAAPILSYGQFRYRTGPKEKGTYDADKERHRPNRNEHRRGTRTGGRRIRVWGSGGWGARWVQWQSGVCKSWKLALRSIPLAHSLWTV